jgi:hypothetical protein
VQFRERLTQEIMTHTRLRPWSMAGMLNENAALRLGLAEKLASMLDPGHLALTRMADKLIALRQQLTAAGAASSVCRAFFAFQTACDV